MFLVNKTLHFEAAASKLSGRGNQTPNSDPYSANHQFFSTARLNVPLLFCQPLTQINDLNYLSSHLINSTLKQQKAQGLLHNQMKTSSLPQILPFLLYFTSILYKKRSPGLTKELAVQQKVLWDFQR